MSLRVKFGLVVFVACFVSVALVGLLTYQRLMGRFDEMVRADSARRFAADVESYWLTYGSWDAGQHQETFLHFVQRRKAATGERLEPDGPGPARFDSPVAPAAALPPWSPGRSGGRPEGPDGSSAPPAFMPPFRFVLFDLDDRILGPKSHVGRSLSPDEKRNADPVYVSGRLVAHMVPAGVVNLSRADLAHLAAVRDAMIWSIAAAAVLAGGLGLAVGSGMSRSLRRLTGAIRDMQDGVLRQHVDIASRDEVGVLARAFNAMSDDLARSHEKLQDQHRTISRQAEQLRELAVRDALTGLHNRRHFDDGAGRMHQDARRHGTPFAIAMADIDFFKRINDTFSHAVGDTVLREVGRLLAGQVRGSDLVARYGGEEFVFAFAHADRTAVLALCERLRLAVETHDWRTIQPGLEVRISVGVCADPSLPEIGDMMAFADLQLYAAKISGRNRVCCDVAAERARVA